jgi:hypothetical protein
VVAIGLGTRPIQNRFHGYENQESITNRDYPLLRLGTIHKEEVFQYGNSENIPQLQD